MLQMKRERKEERQGKGGKKGRRKNLSLKNSHHSSWPWWCTPVNPAPGKLRQEDLKMESSRPTWAA
jgi:hypothetical protein